MASPPCCPPNSTPALDHKPPFVGRIVDIENNGAALKSYVTGSPLESSTVIVIVFSDVFGYNSGRHFEFADHLSILLNKNVKSTVLVPDVFMGKPLFVEHGFLPGFLSYLWNLPSFLFRVHSGGAKKFIDPVYNILLPWLVEQGMTNFSASSLSWVGFCFGGWLGCKVTAYSHNEENDNDTIQITWKCGVGIHPALLPERIIVGKSEEELITSLGDFSVKLMPASNDPYHPGKSKVVEIMALNQSLPQDQVSIPFDNVKHGFCSRGDSNDDSVRNAQEKAERLTAEYILEQSSKH